jgi:type II secretory pathway component PulJ
VTWPDPSDADSHKTDFSSWVAMFALVGSGSKRRAKRKTRGNGADMAPCDHKPAVEGLERKPKMKKHIIIAVAFSVGTVGPVYAGNLDEIEALPFAKAAAYQHAINEYCFPEEKYHNVDLALASLKQRNARRGQDDTALWRKALSHLAGDQSACAPALLFLERTISQLPELNEKLDALIEAQKREMAKAAASATREAQEKVNEEKRQAAESHARDCKTSAELDHLNSPEAQRQPYAIISQLDYKAGQLAHCADIYSAAEIAATLERVKAMKDAANAKVAEEALRTAQQIESEKRQAAVAASKYLVECRYQGLPKMKRTRKMDDTGISEWLTIGKAAPVQLIVGDAFASATTADGRGLILKSTGIDFDGTFHEGRVRGTSVVAT